MKNARKNAAAGTTLLVLFGLFTAAVKRIDVKPIGPAHSLVGFSRLNQRIWNLFGENLIWYHITDWLGVAAILVAFGFGILGLAQAIRRKNPLKADRDLLWLGVYDVVVLSLYLFFEHYIINYRPVILGTALEPSYPSSHTMIVVCIMGSAILTWNRRLRNRNAKIAVNTVSAFIIAATVLGRLISGVHWFTDIFGGLLLSFGLLLLYRAALMRETAKDAENAR